MFEWFTEFMESPLGKLISTGILAVAVLLLTLAAAGLVNRLMKKLVDRHRKTNSSIATVLGFVRYIAVAAVYFAGGMVIEHDVQILDVAVAPERRRAGIARKLLAHVSYDAQMLGCTTASLEVEDGNAPAMALYEHLGFKRIGRRRNYYGQGADALVMQAELPLALPVDAASPEPTSAVMRAWPLAPVDRTEDERTEIERRKLVLAIESSCDETAVAIIDAEG